MFKYLSFVFILFSIQACSQQKQQEPYRQEHISPEINKYWYGGKAEISSYDLKQARYGQIRNGTAVMVFVTEPFSLQSWTKADKESEEDISVMKLNFVKKFVTGIYPYSIMTSSFTPVDTVCRVPLKLSMSSQEWCGHVYDEIKRKKDRYEVRSFSYFEQESQRDFELKQDLTEDNVWATIRLNPEQLREGAAKMIPALSYIRLAHIDTKAYDSQLSKSRLSDSTSSYVIHYPDLDRTLTITYQTSFPHKILSWTDRYYSGWGDNRRQLTSSAPLMETVKTDYWNKNAVKDSLWRNKLNLE